MDSVIAAISAIIVTLVTILDYLLEHLATKGKKRNRLKLALVGVLLLVVWVLAGVQCSKDIQSERDIAYLMKQTAKPSLQLFLNSYTNTADYFVTNLDGAISHQIVVTPTREGLNSGKILQPKTLNSEKVPQPINSRDIPLSLVVWGDVPADNPIIELITPWCGKENITGDTGWDDVTHPMQFMDIKTHTFSPAHQMRLSIRRTIPPNAFVPLPTLHVPTNYPEDSVQIRFIMYANNSIRQEVGVVFKENR